MAQEAEGASGRFASLKHRTTLGLRSDR